MRCPQTSLRTKEDRRNMYCWPAEQIGAPGVAERPSHLEEAQWWSPKVTRNATFFIAPLPFWTSPPALSLVGHHDLIGVARKALTNQPLQSSDFHATEEIFDRTVTDPPWWFYWIWSFILCKNCIGGQRMCWPSRVSIACHWNTGPRQSFSMKLRFCICSFSLLRSQFRGA